MQKYIKAIKAGLTLPKKIGALFDGVKVEEVVAIEQTVYNTVFPFIPKEHTTRANTVYIAVTNLNLAIFRAIKTPSRASTEQVNVRVWELIDAMKG
jgi:hypothetical protein